MIWHKVLIRYLFIFILTLIETPLFFLLNILHILNTLLLSPLHLLIPPLLPSPPKIILNLLTFADPLLHSSPLPRRHPPLVSWLLRLLQGPLPLPHLLLLLFLPRLPHIHPSHEFE